MGREAFEMIRKRIGVAFVLGLAIVLAMTSIAIARPATNADDEAGMAKAPPPAMPFTVKYRQQISSEAFDQAHTPKLLPSAPFTPGPLGRSYTRTGLQP